MDNAVAAMDVTETKKGWKIQPFGWRLVTSRKPRLYRIRDHIPPDRPMLQPSIAYMLLVLGPMRAILVWLRFLLRSCLWFMSFRRTRRCCADFLGRTLGMLLGAFSPFRAMLVVRAVRAGDGGRWHCRRRARLRGRLRARCRLRRVVRRHQCLGRTFVGRAAVVTRIALFSLIAIVAVGGNR